MHLFVGTDIAMHPIFAANEAFISDADANLQLFVKQFELINGVGGAWSRRCTL